MPVRVPRAPCLSGARAALSVSWPLRSRGVRSSMMFSENGALTDELFRRWRDNPESVDPTWQAFFAGLEFAGKLPGGGGVAVTPPADLRLQTGAVRLIFWYRQAGHLEARIDPLATAPPPPCPFLALERFSLSDADLDKTVDG